MRILVMIRKNWGGNRTENGARTQAILTSVLCTARQQDQDIFHLLVDLLRSQQPKPLDMLPPEIDDTNDIEGQRVPPHKCGQPKRATEIIGTRSASQSVWKCCCSQCNRQPLRQSSVQVEVEAKGLGQSPPGRQIHTNTDSLVAGLL